MRQSAVVRVAVATLLITCGAFAQQTDTQSLRNIREKDGLPPASNASVEMPVPSKGNLAPAPEPELEVDRSHKVEHISLLNKDAFWWLMGSLMLLIALAVVTIEVSEKRASNNALANDGETSPLLPRRGARGRGKDEAAVWVALRLAFCIIGLNISMLLWGISQEFVMTNEYENASGGVEKIPSSLFLVLCNRLGSVFFSGLLALFVGEPLAFSSYAAASLPALSNLAASWCQYSSISYISFPLQTTTKSAKLMPVLLIGMCRGKKQSLLDIAEAIVITVAVVVFGLETDGQDSNTDVAGMGVMLLGGMMFFDSITPHLQDALFQKFPDLMVIQATFSMAVLASLVSFVMLLSQGMLMTCWVFLQEHPNAFLHIGVLALCSTLTQFLITYTIKNFGPLAFIIIVTTRQVISVCLSSVLFMHHLCNVAIVAAVIVFGTVFVRALRKMSTGHSDPFELPDRQAAQDLGLLLPRWMHGMVSLSSQSHRLMVCAVAIHIPLCFWAVAQEFMVTHTWAGQLFPSVLFIIAVNRTVGVFFCCGMLQIRGLPLVAPDMMLSGIPGVTNLFASFCQYEALYYIRFPKQTLLKTLKVIPAMIGGAFLKNRVYATLDYLEAALITGLAAFFVWYCEVDDAPVRADYGLIGIMLMILYLAIDAVSVNAEDKIYQITTIDPCHMMLGSELISGCVCWVLLIATGSLHSVFDFLWMQPRLWVHLVALAMASTCGAYACTVTVKLFGPVVFTLLMMSRQMISLVVSVELFQHTVDRVGCLCLLVVALLVLTSALRRVSSTPSWQKVS
mmetsp:Transcript_43832/g.95429  ORF Transcript_43832/g.95429 Transcript_43832/m.95429 type:complete len:793 (-) Transcript_43832:123-2501(-)